MFVWETGTANNEQHPLPLQFAIKIVTEGFKEYGSSNINTKKRGGRETNSLQREGNKRSSGEIHQDQSGESEAGRSRSTEQSQEIGQSPNKKTTHYSRTILIRYYVYKIIAI